MKFKALNAKINIDQNVKLHNVYAQYTELLNVLGDKELNQNIISAVNEDIALINECSESEKELKKRIVKAQSGVIKLIEKELKLVTINHYRNTWLALGISVFGVPLGVAFGASMDNMGYLGIGLPFGMLIGMVVGTRMDKKAKEEGRQLDIEMKY
jgi:hypothetical protein